MTPQESANDVATFKEHCVVSEAWLAKAYSSKLPFHWHPKILGVLELVKANGEDLDKYVERAKSAGAGKFVSDVAQYKRRFFEASCNLDGVLDRVREGYPRLLEQLGSRDLSDILRARALHTFAGAAALTLIKALQLFEKVLVSEQGGVIVRMFTDLPSLSSTHTPMIVLPYRHAVNGLAYGYEVDNGLVRARICAVYEDSYQKVSLPRHEAEYWQDFQPGPEHLYFGWVLPQWLVAGFGELPPLPTWSISVLSDAKGNERYIKNNDPEWAEGLKSSLLLDADYVGLKDDFFALSRIAPGLTVWVFPRTAGACEIDAESEATEPGGQLSDEQLGAASEAGRMPIVLCIAAAHVEFVAARERFSTEFGKARKMSMAGETDHAVVFTDASSGTLWVLTVQSFQAEVDAALKAQRLVLTLKPHVTLMIGMCMGIGDQAFGTVVVPNEVRGFDHQRSTPAGLEYRPHGDLTDNPLYGFARIFDASPLSYKVVVDKGLASASAKLEDVSGLLLKQITTNFPDAVAYDMEGWGFYRGVKAARNDGRERCLWIKGVADNGETQNTTPEAKEAKKGQQALATSNALDFAIKLMRDYFVVSVWRSGVDGSSKAA